MRFLWLLFLISTSAFAVTNEELERKINILADEIAQLKASQQQVSTGQQAFGLGQAASKVYFINSGLSIGGYAEVVYNNQSHEKQNGDPTNREPKTEALRNVIYLGYKFNEKWLINSEIEIEHVDEVYSEFLYVDYLGSDTFNMRFGLSLIPMGLTNELHEPIYFNSVKRPEVEQFLIPTTWREIGVGAFGALGNFTYKAFVYNGADADAIASGTNQGLRKGRKKGGAGNTAASQNASTYAVVLRGDYNFDTASSLGAAIYRGEGSSANGGNNYIDMEITIAEIHGIYRHKAFSSRFLYTNVDLTNATEWNKQAASTHYIPNKMNGYYIELGYDLETKEGEIFTPFIRYEDYDLNAEVDSNFLTRDKSLDRTSTYIGLAYKPLDRLVFKADYVYKKNAQETGINEFNLGLGFVY
jgi:hypothetical protein